jgi:hypothetical protein
MPALLSANGELDNVAEALTLSIIFPITEYLTVTLETV